MPGKIWSRYVSPCCAVTCMRIACMTWQVHAWHGACMTWQVHAWHGCMHDMASACMTWLHAWHGKCMHDMVACMTWQVHAWHGCMHDMASGCMAWHAMFFTCVVSCWGLQSESQVPRLDSGSENNNTLFEPLPKVVVQEEVAEPMRGAKKSWFGACVGCVGSRWLQHVSTRIYLNTFFLTNYIRTKNKKTNEIFVVHIFVYQRGVQVDLSSWDQLIVRWKMLSLRPHHSKYIQLCFPQQKTVPFWSRSPQPLWKMGQAVKPANRSCSFSIRMAKTPLQDCLGQPLSSQRNHHEQELGNRKSSKFRHENL